MYTASRVFDKVARNIHAEKDAVFDRWWRRNLDIYMQKNKMRSLFLTVYKNQLKMDYMFKYKVWNYKTTLKSEGKLQDSGLSNNFMGKITKAQSTIAKIDKW